MGSKPAEWIALMQRGIIFSALVKIADAEFLASIAHQAPQVVDLQTTNLMDSDQQRRANRRPAAANLADYRRRHVKHARQCRVVLDAKIDDQYVEQSIGVVVRRCSRVGSKAHFISFRNASICNMNNTHKKKSRKRMRHRKSVEFCYQDSRLRSFSLSKRGGRPAALWGQRCVYAYWVEFPLICAYHELSVAHSSSTAGGQVSRSRREHDFIRIDRGWPVERRRAPRGRGKSSAGCHCLRSRKIGAESTPPRCSLRRPCSFGNCAGSTCRFRQHALRAPFSFRSRDTAPRSF